MSSSQSFRTRRWRAVTTLAGAGALTALATVSPLDEAEPTRAAMSPTPVDPPAAAATETAAEPVTSSPLSDRVMIAASGDVQPAPEPDAVAAEAAAPEPAPAPQRSVWDQVADCESGSWTGDGGFVEASANWASTSGQFEGGLQFHPGTWDSYRDPGMPGAAYEATREQQIAVAERVLAEQGWGAWPVCSAKLGLR